ncbi:MAG: 3-dehydroquinate synthase II [Deltaproteobacteria bacterium]|nr:3-dehydroquinate synthase II [Deltaproteobacteria bacterium]MBW1845936.1 3-dehydroquinate synthase II [Deltaproteobacteria bacterium]MBW2364155.1 3-dehydroquinate synthase II [Deltaproteobacteria bacterium]
MRKIWIKIDPWDKNIVTTALEGGADGVVIPDGYSERVKELGKIQTISSDGDLKIGKDVELFKIVSGEDEEEIVKLSKKKKVILQCSDWTIIPIENLIAKGAEVIAQVNSAEDAQTAFGILEKGVNHIMYHASDALELKKVLSTLRSEEDHISLKVAEIIEIKPVGMGDRVCVDTCTSMAVGQGMLIGNSSSALFLVHAESISNPYVSPRPFRVNAGAVHAYIRVTGGKTKYLSELSSGDPVLIVDHQGKTETCIVGRLKIEKRPLMFIKAMVSDKEINTIVQNAETIRLTDPKGKAVSVVKLKTGDKVLVAVEEAGRHFGHKIDESITEK